MSHSRDHEDTGRTTAYYQGYKAGVEANQKRIIALLQADLCEDEGCLQCDTTDFHIEIIQSSQNNTEIGIVEQQFGNPEQFKGEQNE